MPKGPVIENMACNNCTPKLNMVSVGVCMLYCTPVMSRPDVLHKLLNGYLKVLLSSQIAGFFDHQYLWKETNFSTEIFTEERQCL